MTWRPVGSISTHSKSFESELEQLPLLGDENPLILTKSKAQIFSKPSSEFPLLELGVPFSAYVHMALFYK